MCIRDSPKGCNTNRNAVRYCMVQNAVLRTATREVNMKFAGDKGATAKKFARISSTRNGKGLSKFWYPDADNGSQRDPVSGRFGTEARGKLVLELSVWGEELGLSPDSIHNLRCLGYTHTINPTEDLPYSEILYNLGSRRFLMTDAARCVQSCNRESFSHWMSL